MMAFVNLWLLGLLTGIMLGKWRERKNHAN
jgi:hypothetical protein